MKLSSGNSTYLYILSSDSGVSLRDAVILVDRTDAVGRGVAVGLSHDWRANHDAALAIDQ